MYEYYDKTEREMAIDENIELEADKIEEAQEAETLDWIEEEEKRDQEAAEAKQKEADDKWMVDQLKKEHGEDFGDDIDLDF